MPEHLIEEREQELQGLLNLFATHPERAWTAERERAAVLRGLLSADRANA
jgi:hypothetical protein